MFVGEMLCLIPVILHQLHGSIIRLLDRRRSYDALPANGSNNGYGAVDQTPAVESGHPFDTTRDGPTKADDEPEIQGRSMLLFLLPALCDIVGTTLMNVGLILCPVSIYQYVASFHLKHEIWD